MGSGNVVYNDMRIPIPPGLNNKPSNTKNTPQSALPNPIKPPTVAPANKKGK
jgi:hypothetical protein